MKLAKSFLNVESLEERLVPAFDFFYNPSGDIWTVTQVQDDGDATITVDAITNDLVVDDGAGGPVTVGVAQGSLTINMMDNSDSDLVVVLDELMFGNVSINLGNGGDGADDNGVRNLDLTGAANTVLGNFSVTGGTIAQDVQLSTNALLSVGGSFNMNLGLGNDTVTSASGVNVGGNMSFFNVNDVDIDDSGVTVGGNMSIRNTDNEISGYDALGGGVGVTIIGGNFTYTGGNNFDNVFLNGGDLFGGSVNISLGNNISGGVQNVNLNDATIGGNLTIRGGTIDGDDVIT